MRSAALEDKIQVMYGEITGHDNLTPIDPSFVSAPPQMNLGLIAKVL
jgi:hypothetical protein